MKYNEQIITTKLATYDWLVVYGVEDFLVFDETWWQNDSEYDKWIMNMTL